MSFEPSLPKQYATLQPTMPPPTTTTRASEGSVVLTRERLGGRVVRRQPGRAGPLWAARWGTARCAGPRRVPAARALSCTKPWTAPYDAPGAFRPRPADGKHAHATCER